MRIPPWKRIRLNSKMMAVGMSLRGAMRMEYKARTLGDGSQGEEQRFTYTTNDYLEELDTSRRFA